MMQEMVFTGFYGFYLRKSSTAEVIIELKLHIEQEQEQ